MKKVVVFLSSVAMLFSLSACTESSTEALADENTTVVVDIEDNNVQAMTEEQPPEGQLPVEGQLPDEGQAPTGPPPGGELPEDQVAQGDMVDLADAAALLGITEDELIAALGDPEAGLPDFAATAELLGITEVELLAAMGMNAQE